MDQEKLAWVSRVLGIEVADAGQAAPKDPSVALVALEPSLLQAIRLAPAERTALMAAWEYASEQAAAGQAATVENVIARLTRRIDAILAAEPRSDAESFGIRPGTVLERRHALQRFFAQRISAATQQSCDEVEKLLPELDELIEEPNDLVEAIQAHVHELLDRLRNVVAAGSPEGNERDLTKAIEAWQKQTESDPRMAGVRKAAAVLGCDVDIDGAVAVLVSDMRSQLRLMAI